MAVNDDLKYLPFGIVELQKSGLLWYINHHLLHRHSLALAVTFPVTGERPRLEMVHGYDSFPDDVNLERAKAVQEWIIAELARFEAMP